MTKPTKEQVEKLTPEQHGALGDFEVQRIRSRQRLLERARRGVTMGTGVLMGLAGGLTMLCVAFPRLLPIAIIAVAGLGTFQTVRLHRRLDALMQLLDDDIKRVTDAERGDDDSVG